MRTAVNLAFAAFGLAEGLHVLHEKRHEFSYLGTVSPLESDAIIPVRIGLVQSNIDRGYDHLMQVSDPDSKSYGQLWTAEEVENEFSPSEATVSAVLEWLREAGIAEARQSAGKGWISFDAPVHQVNGLLATNYNVYTGEDGLQRLGCDQYSLPSEMSAHIDYVVPGVKLSPPMEAKSDVKRSLESPLTNGLQKQKPKKPGVKPPAHNNVTLCGHYITPICWQTMYELPQPNSATIGPGKLGFFENGDAYAQEDLNSYFTAYAQYVHNGTHPALVSVNGAKAPVPVSSQEDTGESDVDFSIAYSLLGNINTTLYQVQTPKQKIFKYATIIDPFLDAIDGAFCTPQEKAAGFQCGTVQNFTQVVSFSYGAPELFYQTAPSQVRACNEFMKLGLQGHTFVVSSGDSGVASNPSFANEKDNCANGCIPANLKNNAAHSFNGTIFSPQFPANCPYVLTVGATMLTNHQTVKDVEVGMDVPEEIRSNCPNRKTVSFSSGGGFSNYFAQPSYQSSAVSSWAHQHAPSSLKTYTSNLVDVTLKNTTIGANGGVYNIAGRAFPDVAANGAKMLAYSGGTLGEFSGTSIAAPIWASMIALINAARAKAGKSPVGFINPALYKNPSIFTDIISGSNQGCYSAGFSAVPGWDPVTGLGTPNYPKLLALFESLA